MCVCLSGSKCVGVGYFIACEKLDLVELCQPGGQKSVMFAGFYSNQALFREIRKEMVYEEETERGEKRVKDFIVHPEFECMWGGTELKSASSVVTQLCCRGSEECKYNV